MVAALMVASLVVPGMDRKERRAKCGIHFENPFFSSFFPTVAAFTRKERVGAHDLRSFSSGDSVTLHQLAQPNLKVLLELESKNYCRPDWTSLVRCDEKHI